MRLIAGFSGMTWALLVVLALAVAGVTHAATVLTIPWRSPHDAFARVAALVPPGRKVDLSNAPAADGPLPFRDPAFVTAVCRYDLAAQPFRLAMTPFADGFVTIGFHSRHGLAFYGLTVRAADETQLDLEIVDKGAGRDTGVNLGQHVITVEAPEPEGFVVLATPAGDGPEHGEADDRLAAFTCRAEAPAPAP